MTLLVKSKDNKHRNYYEGSHVGFHEETRDDGKWLVVVVVEDKGSETTVESPEGEGAEFYLMNKFGKTVETRIS